MTTTDIIDILTQNNVSVRIERTSDVVVTLEKDGIRAEVKDSTVDAALSGAYQWAFDNRFIKRKPEYLPQCKDCMCRISGNVLQVCCDADNAARHHNWHYTNNHDHCLYKIFFDHYSEDTWRTLLTRDQFTEAVTLCKSPNVKK